MAAVAYAREYAAWADERNDKRCEWGIWARNSACAGMKSGKSTGRVRAASSQHRPAQQRLPALATTTVLGILILATGGRHGAMENKAPRRRPERWRFKRGILLCRRRAGSSWQLGISQSRRSRQCGFGGASAGDSYKLASPRKRNQPSSWLVEAGEAELSFELNDRKIMTPPGGAAHDGRQRHQQRHHLPGRGGERQCIALLKCRRASGEMASTSRAGGVPGVAGMLEAPR